MIGIQLYLGLVVGVVVGMLVSIIAPTYCVPPTVSSFGTVGALMVYVALLYSMRKSFKAELAAECARHEETQMKYAGLAVLISRAGLGDIDGTD